jgi:hypothetical protein
VLVEVERWDAPLPEITVATPPHIEQRDGL